MTDTPFYDRFLKWAPGLAVVAFLGQAMLSNHLEKWVHRAPFELVQSHLMDDKVVSTLRALAFVSGYKVLVGHAFWIKTIQYYGDISNSATRYAKLYEYCSLASDLNPQFVPVYTFGASALAIHLKRIDEAERLLLKGIRANPGEPWLKKMSVAILYQNTEQFDKFIPFLKAEIDRGDAPRMMVNILANTYQKIGHYGEAVELWQKILRETDDQAQRIEAAQKLQQLYQLLKSKRKN